MSDVEQPGSLEIAERAVERGFKMRQFIALTQRHQPEDLILLHVLQDNHHHAALEAKAGRIAVARAEMHTLDTMAPASGREIEAVYDVSSLPVWALIRWREGSPDEATALLRRALAACADLATEFKHDYLTAKRIHLATNIARVFESAGAQDHALAHVKCLQSVVAGNSGQWPFESCESLLVPLEGFERQIIEYQLARISRRAQREASPDAAQRSQPTDR